MYVVVEVPRDRAVARLDPRAVGDALGAGGPIAAHLAMWEDRPSQRAMAERIAKLYNGGGIALFEAGTGVGKSLGYLVPALRWSAANGERTIVSTNTINLQEQLVGKDLPFLRDALGDQPVRFALLKGWRNYLCLQRLEQAVAAPAGMFDDGRRDEIDGLRAWAERTADGSLSDLPVAPRPEVWDEVAAESDLCGRLKCPHFEKCFLFKARKLAAQADVVVVNHHLLLADLAVRRAQQNWGDAAVLPAYTRLVIDEGHHLEDAGGVASREHRHAPRARAAARATRAARQGAALRAHAAAQRARRSPEHREPRSRARAPRARGARRARQGRAALRPARDGARRERPVAAPAHRGFRVASRHGAPGSTWRSPICWARSRCCARGFASCANVSRPTNAAPRRSRRCSPRCARSRGASKGSATASRARCARRPTPNAARCAGSRRAARRRTSRPSRCRSTSRRSCARISS